MSKQIIITRWENRIASCTLDEGQLIQIYFDSEKEKSKLGNIYIGKVKNIVKNIQAAFVEIQDGIICYLSLTEKGTPIFVSPKKNETIKVGDELLVQLVKENIKTKQPVLSINIHITGKYVVLAKGKRKVFISSKIIDQDKRNCLQELAGPCCKEDYGIIIRTNAAFASDEQILEEINRFTDIFKKLKESGIYRTRFSCVYRAPTGYLCNIRDAYHNEVDQIITNDEIIFNEMKEYTTNFQKEDIAKLHFYQEDRLSLHALYNLNSQLEKAMKKKVWLSCGGTIIIEPTEACTVIDVNTGKAIQGKKKPGVIFRKVNLQAAEEIAVQLRLRNLSGIILVDFIDMESEEDQQELIHYFGNLLKKDPIKTILVDMTSLGLVEITRKKVRKPLHEQWKECDG